MRLGQAILDERLARGEITLEEHSRMTSIIEQRDEVQSAKVESAGEAPGPADSPTDSPMRGKNWGTVAAVLVAGFVLAAILTSEKTGKAIEIAAKGRDSSESDAGCTQTAMQKAWAIPCEEEAQEANRRQYEEAVAKTQRGLACQNETDQAILRGDIFLPVC